MEENLVDHEEKRKSSKRVPECIHLIYLFGNRRKYLGERGMVVAWYTGGVNVTGFLLNPPNRILGIGHGTPPPPPLPLHVGLVIIVILCSDF